MSNSFHCGDKEAIVAFLYDECEPREREIVASHIARCARCAEELDALSATRTELAAWTPPAVALGFRITEPIGLQLAGPGLRPAGPVSESASGDDRRSTPGVWWQRPLPAWAQTAAAALIFGAGLMLGSARDVARPDAVIDANRPVMPAVARSLIEGTPPTAVSVEDLVQLEARLRAAIVESRQESAVPARVGMDEKAVVERLQALIAASEERQREEMAFRTAALVRDFDLQRRADLQQVQLKMGQLQGTTGAEVREQREALRFVMNQLQVR